MNGSITYWEWNVDPLTRKVIAPEADLLEIKALIEGEDRIVAQNSKFDATMLICLFRDNGIEFRWPFEKVEDTLIAGHVLYSNRPHNLTDMATQYLGVDISAYEIALRKECIKARNIAKRRYPDWIIAKEGVEGMPSAKGGNNERTKKGVESDSPWKFDMWLPRALIQRMNEPKSHPWYTITSDYANQDSEVTLPLWLAQEKQLEEQGLTKIYRERLKAVKLAYDLEEYGFTVKKDNLNEVMGNCVRERDQKYRLCMNIAGSYKEADGTPFELVMPKGASPNDSIRHLIFDLMKVKGVAGAKAKTERPSLDAASTAKYLLELNNASKPHVFLTSLMHKRKRDTAITYMNAYKRFWKEEGNGVCRLHPFFNPTGTKTLRWSSYNPNAENVSDKESECKICEGDGCDKCNNTGIDFRSLRYAFGPKPGREWWKTDGKNLELRIPAYYAKEEAFIALFERPNDPPYYGSNHLLIAHILFPSEFEKGINADGVLDGRIFKAKYPQIYAKNIKCGNFALQYGAGDETADKTYGIPGARRRIKSRFVKQEALNQQCISHAKKYGYVETIPDRSVDPEHGYRLMLTRTEFGKILETEPFNYFVQGTACFWIHRCMVKVEAQLEKWRATGFDIRMVNQVHDELVLECPKSKIHPSESVNKSNLWRINHIRRIMESCGDDIGIPTPCSAGYRPDNWAEGVDF
jgi:DNA polymerase I-like protein with 3'-5' exonuclease and polymerase domains